MGGGFAFKSKEWALGLFKISAVDGSLNALGLKYGSDS